MKKIIALALFVATSSHAYTCDEYGAVAVRMYDMRASFNSDLGTARDLLSKIPPVNGISQWRLFDEIGWNFPNIPRAPALRSIHREQVRQVMIQKCVTKQQQEAQQNTQ